MGATNTTTTHPDEGPTSRDNETFGQRLYSPAQITLACLLGTPLAGSLLLTVNARAQKRPDGGKHLRFHGALATALLVYAYGPYPRSLVAAVMQLMYTAAMFYTARKGYAAAVAQHLTAGGQLQSYGRVLGIAALCMSGALVFAHYGGLIIAWFVLGLPATDS